MRSDFRQPVVEFRINPRRAFPDTKSVPSRGTATGRKRDRSGQPLDRKRVCALAGEMSPRREWLAVRLPAGDSTAHAARAARLGGRAGLAVQEVAARGRERIVKDFFLAHRARDDERALNRDDGGGCAGAR